MRLYFASDIHGSEKCWLKFLRTPEYYDADVIVIGGDITGKFVVPIVKQPDGTAVATLHGVKERMKGPEEIEAMQRRIAFAGSYGVVMTEDEHEHYANDPGALSDVFQREVFGRVERWMELAEERLDGNPIRCLVSCGNDDVLEIDDILAASGRVESPDGGVLEILPGVEMIGVGWANETPWQCPRDIPESELAGKIEALAGRLSDPERAIFNCHVPPFDSGLDMAARLTDDLQLVMSSSGDAEMVPVGSTAVREAIERYRPALGLHGHIHESRGIAQLGSTTIVNPGSEYQDGILHGAVIDFAHDGSIKSSQLVSG
jgi:Icc-related predicted phosphoesterase